MRHLPILEVMARALRERICTACFLRPRGSEDLPPDVARTCEAACPIFLNLPHLRKIDDQVQDASPGGFEGAIQNTICARCTRPVSGGDYCPEHIAETCPLAVYGKSVMEILDRVIEELRRHHLEDPPTAQSA